MRPSSPAVRLSAALLLAFGVCAADVAAQSIAAPQRAASTSLGGASGRPGHDAVVSGSVQGGYDDDLATEFAGPIEDASISGYAAFSDLGLLYTFSGVSWSFGSEGRGYLVAYPDSDIPRSLGGDLSLRGSKSLGRTQIFGGGALRYTPYYSLEAFQSLTTASEVSELPDSSPVNGIPNDQSLIRDGFVGVSRQWSTRQGSTMQLNRIERDRQGQFGSDLNSWDAQFTHDFRPTRLVHLTGSYLFSRTRFQQLDGAVSGGDMDTHSIELAVSRTVRVSSSRSIIIGGGGGADRVSGILATGSPYTYWAPTGRANAQFDVGRNWSVMADFRRTVVPLDGVSGQSFPSNVFFFNGGGPLWGRLSTALSAGYAGGRSGAAESTSDFRTYNGTAQLDLAISRLWTVNVTYNIYDYRIEGQVGAPGELPGSLRRGTIRVGLSAAVPLTRGSRATPRRPVAR